MTDIEIPLEKDRKGHYRFFEILPGFLSWLLLFLPIILTFINVDIAVIFILAYLIIYFVRTLGFDVRAVSGYRTFKKYMKLDWEGLCEDLNNGQVTKKDIMRPAWHNKNLRSYKNFETTYHPNEVIHAVIIATVNESKEVLKPTLDSLISGTYDSRKLLIVIAYEGRAGAETEQRVNDLIKEYKSNFKDMISFKHPPGIPDEIIGKGGNISFAGRGLHEYLKKNELPIDKVLVTTLDADNRPDKRYFSALSYLFCVVPNPHRASFQPLPMFTNNIWDAPTLMRVIATSNNIFYIVQTQRPHLVRNFSAHAQSMKSLIELNFWSARSVVEDGHHYWRSYFYYEGDYRVYPLSIPIYMDAVLADGYVKTLKAQFIQLRRWTYGASDVAYIADKGYFHKNSISKWDVTKNLLRTLESHVTWATGTVLVFFAAFIPPFFRAQSIAAEQLPFIVSRIQQIGIIGLLASVYVCLLTLPPRPDRYKRRRSALMVLQWVIAPVSSIVYGSLAAFNSQTRLILKKYPTRFDVTEKAVITSSGETVSTKADPTKA